MLLRPPYHTYPFIVATWRVSEETPGNWYVTEVIASVPGTVLYGPMPSEETASALVDERRGIVNDMYNNLRSSV